MSLFFFMKQEWLPHTGYIFLLIKRIVQKSYKKLTKQKRYKKDHANYTMFIHEFIVSDKYFFALRITKANSFLKWLLHPSTLSGIFLKITRSMSLLIVTPGFRKENQMYLRYVPESSFTYMVDSKNIQNKSNNVE